MNNDPLDDFFQKMAAWRNVPGQTYRLHDGRKGTEYEAVAECIRTLEAKKRRLEDDIEELKRRLMTADGRPVE